MIREFTPGVVTFGVTSTFHWKRNQNSLKMKKINFLTWLATIMMILGSTQVFANELREKIQGDGHVIKSSKSLPAFNKISADAIDNITVLKSQDGQNSLVIETDENLMPYIKFEVKNGVLSFSYRDIKPTKLRFYVMTSTLQAVKASGASELKAEDLLVGDDFVIHASGAAVVKVNAHMQNMMVEASGASDVFMAGLCRNLKSQLSGAADLKATKMQVDSAFVKASGAATARVNAIKYLYKNLSGVANVKVASSPQQVSGKDNNVDRWKNKVNHMNSRFNNIHFRSDTTRVNVGNMQFEVVDGDSTKVRVGNHTLIVGRNGNVWWRRNNENRFKGHWAGFDLGLNGYVNKNQNANFGKAYDFLSLKYEKSINLNFNIYQQSFALNKANTIGLVTGVGLSFNEYRFLNQVYLDPASDNLAGYYIVNTPVKKSKLSVHYADIPLILEFQSRDKFRNRRFFIGVGVIGNVKLRSRTKIYFTNSNDPYSLQDPATGDIISGSYRTPDQGSRNIVKKTGSYSLNPFRFDATVRAGFRWISLYATYALTPMFQAGRGPNLRQWTAGITLVKW